MLLIVLLLVVVVFYVLHNLKYKEDYQILQLKPQQLSEEVLYEKNPVVVETQEAVHDILNTVALQPLYRSAKQSKATEQWSVNKSRYCVFFHNKDDVRATVEIATPKHGKLDPITDPEYKSMSIILRKDHALILPMLWKYRVDAVINIVSLDDVFSKVYSTLMGGR